MNKSNLKGKKMVEFSYHVNRKHKVISEMIIALIHEYSMQVFNLC